MSPRYEGTDHNPAAYKHDIDPGVRSLAEEKIADPDSVGTASDYAEVTTEANRSTVRARPGTPRS